MYFLSSFSEVVASSFCCTVPVSLIFSSSSIYELICSSSTTEGAAGTEGRGFKASVLAFSIASFIFCANSLTGLFSSSDGCVGGSDCVGSGCS